MEITIDDTNIKRGLKLHYVYVVVFPFRVKPFPSDWHLTLSGAFYCAKMNARGTQEYYEIRKHYMTPIEPNPPYSLSKRYWVFYQHGKTLIRYGQDYTIFDFKINP